MQHLPGDRRVLHHLLSFIVPADYDARIVEGENDQYREFLEGYAPGKEEAITYPEGAGVFVPSGSAVQMSLHYTVQLYSLGWIWEKAVYKVQLSVFWRQMYLAQQRKW